MGSLSFKSSKEILVEYSSLIECVPGIEKYWGHTPADKTKKGQEEKLADHIRRVNECCLALIEAHQLEPVIDGLISDLLPSLGIEESSFIIIGNLIKAFFLGAIAFHDFGKLNENYQVKLGNTTHFQRQENGLKDTHSALGAHLYINFFLGKTSALPEWSKSQTNQLLTAIVFDFAVAIFKHHNSKLFTKEESSIKEEVLEKYNSQLNQTIREEYRKRIGYKEKYQARFGGSLYEPNTGKENTGSAFARYALVKLCFSLLTASDYLATLGYMTEGGDYDRLSPADLGIFTSEDISGLHQKFWKDSVNEAVAADMEGIAATAWDTLQERSNGNLNALRRKLLAEVVLEVRKNPDSFLYYLEAPTGAGKTNLSLALALELMTLDKQLRKVFYVFPFTTLITQTTAGIKEKLGLENDNQIIQLHSKAEITVKSAGEDGTYGKDWTNHVDRLFVQYPITLLSHVRFFDILKSNGKEINYLLHRLANSVVVIDEVQSYSPKFWQHIDYLLSHYARRFNIRFIVMSATLPKLYLLGEEAAVELVEKPQCYFQNANFSGRVQFSFDLWKEKRPDKEEYPQALSELAQGVAERCEGYAAQNGGEVSGIIEFITKKSAAAFAEQCSEHPVLSAYKVLVLSGTILEPRRQEVVRWLKCADYKKSYPRILLICTQVVEAGVDIDMDIGFKDSSLLDSDEQLAGRVNRNAKRPQATVYLFNLDKESGIYGEDPRLKTAQKLGRTKREEILRDKSFYDFYNPIIEDYRSKKGGMADKSGSFLEAVRNLDCDGVHQKLKLIDNDSESVFVPLDLPTAYFSDSEKEKLCTMGIYPNEDDKISGEQVFEKYIEVLTNRTDNFIQSREARYQFQSIMSKFTISVYPELAAEIRKNVPAPEKNEKRWNDYGFVYLDKPDNYYNYEVGFRQKINFSAQDFW